jgi:hypothetical protein
MSHDLMGGYAAYTSPNAALRDMAVSGVTREEQSVSVLASLVSGLTITIVSMVTDD